MRRRAPAAVGRVGHDVRPQVRRATRRGCVRVVRRGDGAAVEGVRGSRMRRGGAGRRAQDGCVGRRSRDAAADGVVERVPCDPSQRGVAGARRVGHGTRPAVRAGGQGEVRGCVRGDGR